MSCYYYARFKVKWPGQNGFQGIFQENGGVARGKCPKTACSSVKFTLANKIEAMHERTLVSVKVEPRSTSSLSSALFILPLFYVIKIYVANVRSQKRVSGNQPLRVPKTRLDIILQSQYP